MIQEISLLMGSDELSHDHKIKPLIMIVTNGSKIFFILFSFYVNTFPTTVMAKSEQGKYNKGLVILPMLWDSSNQSLVGLLSKVLPPLSKQN